MTEKNIRLLSVSFAEPISGKELNAFRGAVAQKVGLEHEWFHNHNNQKQGYHHRYSRLQYKRHKGRPMILCLENGIEEIQKFFMQANWELKLYGRAYPVSVNELRVHEFRLRVEADQMFTYSLSSWLPLTRADNFKAYQQLDSLMERVTFLENLLSKHIFGFYKGMDVFPEERIKVAILDIEKQYRT